jgi:hypothetical protein
MYGDPEYKDDVFYDITLYNDNYPMLPMPPLLTLSPDVGGEGQKRGASRRASSRACTGCGQRRRRANYRRCICWAAGRCCRTRSWRRRN